MLSHRFLTDPSIEAIGEGVAKVLAEVGLLVQNEPLRAAARAAGAAVDDAGETVRFPTTLTQGLVETLRAAPRPQTSTYGGGLAPRVEVQVAQHLYDYRLGESRLGTRDGLADLVKLGESLHGEAGVGHCLLLADVPPLIEPLEAGLLLARHATSPVPPFAWDVRQVDYLREMGELLGRENWFSWGATCIAHPFRFDRAVAAKYFRRVCEGAGGGITAMPVAGMTTPLSLAGFVTVAAAEMIGSWLLARVVNPESPLGGSIWAGSVDMRTGEVSYCAFDSLRYGFALREFLYRWTGRDLPVGGGEYCDAHAPGYFAAWEKVSKASLIAAFTGRFPPIGQGMLDNGKTICPVQLLLEREVAGGLAHLGREVTAPETDLALDDILSVGFGLDSHHFHQDRTLLGFRELAWCPPALDRTGWRGAASDEAVLSRLQQQVEARLAAYQSPDQDPEVIAGLEAVVARARHELAAEL